jgi:hypothetical protein
MDSEWKKLLTSPCPEVREFAIRLACYRSEIDLDVCLDVGQNDPDVRLRCLALDLLMDLDEARDSYLTPRILRDLALETTQPDDVRIVAYKACLFITDLIWSSPKREIESVADIDPQVLQELRD